MGEGTGVERATIGSGIVIGDGVAAQQAAERSNGGTEGRSW
jgi:hypothetical protein